MKHSESIANIVPALINAIQEMPPALLNAVNPFHKNKYADLGMVIETARPVLEKYKLAITQWPTNHEGNIAVESILFHESGEWLSNTVYTPQEKEGGKSMAQAAGSAITYLRRYSYSAILSMYTEEDNDGNVGSGNGNNKRPAPKPATEKPDPKKAKIDAIKRGWVAYAKEVGLMESMDNEDELTEFMKVMKEFINRLPKVKKDFDKLSEEGIAAMDAWRKEVVG